MLSFCLIHSGMQMVTRQSLPSLSVFAFGFLFFHPSFPPSSFLSLSLFVCFCLSVCVCGSSSLIFPVGEFTEKKWKSKKENLVSSAGPDRFTVIGRFQEKENRARLTGTNLQLVKSQVAWLGLGCPQRHRLNRFISWPGHITDSERILSEFPATSWPFG